MRLSPKEKADELVNEMYYSGRYDDKEDIIPAMGWLRAKQCALIAVDECIELHFNLESDANGIGESFKYWLEVKQEIEKL